MCFVFLSSCLVRRVMIISFRHRMPYSMVRMDCLLFSFQVVFVLDYTPKFIVPPIVYEKVNVI